MSLNLDLSNAKESTGFDPIPSGQYFVLVDEATVKSTKAGTGEFIAVKFRVLEGPSEGRFIFESYNIKNPNPQAVEIALGKLRGFMRLAGAKELKLNSASDLLGMRCDAVVKIKEEVGYGPKNVISHFVEHKAPAATGAAAPF